jgi:hypothetical protein
MNRTRHEVLIWYAVAVALACVWVPWRGPVSGNLTKFLGYGCIWSGPSGALTPAYYDLSTIDYGRMVLEVLALTAIFGIGLLVTPGRPYVATSNDSTAGLTTTRTSVEADSSVGVLQQSVLTIKPSERHGHANWSGRTALTLKRVLATWILWAAADLVAAGLLSTAGGANWNYAQNITMICLSLGLLAGCAKLSWAKIR